MNANARLATCSGKAYVMENGQLEPERHGDDTSLGMTKFYRTTCFQAIGGFVREVMWDGIDNHLCRMRGWMACSWDEGTGLLFMAASALSRVNQKPYIVGSAAMLWGWTKAALQRKPRYENPAFRRFLRQYQWRSLLMGKEKALQSMEHGH